MTFFDATGRIGIVRFLLAALATLAVLLGCIDGLMMLPTWTNPLIGAVAGLALCGLWCEAARRLQDQGIPPQILIFVAPVLGGIALAILFLIWVDTQAWVIGGSSLLAAAVLFLRPGNRVANRFGAPPPRLLARGAGTARTSRWWTILAPCLAIAAGAGIGYMLYALEQGMRAQVEQSARATAYY